MKLSAVRYKESLGMKIRLMWGAHVTGGTDKMNFDSVAARSIQE